MNIVMRFRYALRALLVLIYILNLTHPVIHRFEDGSLDATLDYLDIWAWSMIPVAS
jgi:hypothetical protein